MNIFLILWSLFIYFARSPKLGFISDWLSLFFSLASVPPIWLPFQLSPKILDLLGLPPLRLSLLVFGISSHISEFMDDCFSNPLPNPLSLWFLLFYDVFRLSRFASIFFLFYWFITIFTSFWFLLRAFRFSATLVSYFLSSAFQPATFRLRHFSRVSYISVFFFWSVDFSILFEPAALLASSSWFWSYSSESPSLEESELALSYCNLFLISMCCICVLTSSACLMLKMLSSNDSCPCLVALFNCSIEFSFISDALSCERLLAFSVLPLFSSSNFAPLVSSKMVLLRRPLF